MSPNLDTTPTIIYRVETIGGHVDHIIAECNEAALKLFHTTRNKFIGRSIREFIPDPEFKQLATWRGDFLQQRPDISELTSIAYEFQREDGTLFTAEVRTMRAVMTMILNPIEE